MGINIHDPLVQIKVTESVCGFVAICMTLLRLWIRRTRYWWDDAWALFSLLCLFVQIGTVFMHVEHPSDLSRLSRIVAYYLMCATFYAVIWSARISILFSIIRIDPDPVIRQRLKWLAAVFVGAIGFFLAQLFWICENKHDGWKDTASPQCHLPKQVPICQLVSDVLADLSLILLPIRLLRGILDKRLRWRLIFIFSTSIVTTIVSLVHAAYIITKGGIPELISALVEDCMSLTVANVPVVVTALLRCISGTNSHDANDDDDGQRWTALKFRTQTTRPPGSTTRWTTSFGFSRGGVSIGNTTELTSTTLDTTKKTLPTYSVSSLGQDEMFAGAKTDSELDENAKKGKDGGVVRIDVLPYPRKPPPSET